MLIVTQKPLFLGRSESGVGYDDVDEDEEFVDRFIRIKRLRVCVFF